MTYENIKKGVAFNIGYVDSSGDFLTGKDVTETDIGNAVNNRYLDDLFPFLSSQYPEDFRQVGKFDFYKTTGTVSASSTSTTLVASTAIFNTGMVGDRVYNSTDETSATITAYSSTTTVTVDTEIDDDWDGDTIYVLGHEFGLGGNATDARSLTSVAVKYSTDDSYYTECRRVNEDQVKGGDVNYSNSPIWYPTTVDISGTPTSAIGILPEPSTNVANGVEIKYIETPASMSSDADVPRLPLGSHSTLIYGATADVLRKLMRLDEADRFEQLYMARKGEMVASYALTRGGSVPRIRPPRRLNRIVNRLE